jgi:hypothetical protein
MIHLVAVLSAMVATSPQVTIVTPGHTPKINTHWTYVVHASEGGKPVAASITAQLVDPLGTVHPVRFGKLAKNITNTPFKGSFSDYIVWPPISSGLPLTLRIRVRVGAVLKTLTYVLTPHA